jgi:hypothetical protein
MTDQLARQRQLIGTAADWSLNDLKLADGEVAIERPTTAGLVPRFKFGFGGKRYSELPYVGETVVSASSYGLDPTGGASNDLAFSKLVADVNAVPLSARPVAVRFEKGVYKYGITLDFRRPVCLYAAGDATLNYTGNTIALKLGPDDIANFDVYLQGEYTVDGLRFTGGALATHAIYINEKVIEPRIRNCTFEDFGTPTSYDVFGQYENWDVLVENCRKLTYSSPTAVGHFIAFPGRKRDNSAYDGGNSRVTIRDCFMTSYSGQHMGIFAYVNAVKSRIMGGGFQHSSGGIQLGGLASGTIIDGVYTELSTPTSPYYIQAFSIDAGGGQFHHPQNVIVRGGYINAHQEVIGGAGRLLKAGDANVKITGWSIEDLSVASFQNGQILIEQNDIAGQGRNVYKNLRSYWTPLETDPGDRFALRGTYANAEAWGSFDASDIAWTPSLGGSATYTARSGREVLQGKTVTATFDMTVNVLGTGSTSVISGLHFPCGPNSGAGSVGFYVGLAVAPVSLALRVDAGTSAITVTGLTAAAATMPGTLGVFASGARLQGSVTYQTA